MAEAPQHIDFMEVKAQDIIADRVQGLADFVRAAKWTIGVVAILLLGIYLLWG